MTDHFGRRGRRPWAIVATASIIVAGVVASAGVASASAPGANSGSRPATGKPPRIDVQMLVNGDDADRPSGPSIEIPGTATFTYVVTNTGKRPLDRIELTDSVLGAVRCPKTTLAVGEKMTCATTSAKVTATGKYKRSAKVVGRYKHKKDTDTDPVHYTGVVPEYVS
jgi:hypothetical protein